MSCDKCGHEIGEDDIFCGYCGYKIGHDFEELFVIVKDAPALKFNQFCCLLDQGANVNARENDVFRSPILLMAAIWNRFSIVELLLERGSDVNAGDTSSVTPLHGASERCHTNIVKLLIDSGANVNEQDKYGNIPLHEVFSGDMFKKRVKTSDRIETMKVLLDSGADVNARNVEGITPLHRAADLPTPLVERRDLKEICRVLLESGAEINAKSNNGHTPLYYASKNYRDDVTTFLEQRGAVR